MLGKLLFFLLQPLLLLQDLFIPAQMPPPPVGQFVKGINLGGETVTVEGNTWLSYRSALADGLATSGATAAATYVVPQPHVGSDLRKVLNTVIFRPQTLEISQTLPNGSYEVYLWMMENFKSNWHALDVKIGGRPMAKAVGQMDRGSWQRYGPYGVTVTDGSLHLTLTTQDPQVDAHLMGLSIFQGVQ